jgi:hypothetical protein
LQLIDIRVRDKAVHPNLPGRVTGHVCAVIQETIGGQDHTHDLVISVWADVAVDTSEADVDMALMLKGAEIVGRLKTKMSEPKSL